MRPKNELLRPKNKWVALVALKLSVALKLEIYIKSPCLKG